MPSFDVVSKVDQHELQNTVDQVERELTNRFDFRNLETEVTLQAEQVTLIAPEEFQVKQMYEIFLQKAVKRGLEVKSFDPQDITKTLAKAQQLIQVKQGISKESAKKIVQFIKASKLKVQASVQGDTVRITGKKRDDLQAVISFVKEAELELPLDFVNFRD